MANGLSIQPLEGGGGFNWIFLIEILVCGILALFFLFYFNRLFATVIAYCIRAWTWHKYKAYIDISALQISLLGGRIFFKSIRYHAHNITVLVYEGHITWRYWLRLVQDAEVFAVENVEEKRRQRAASASKTEDEQKSSSDEKDREKPRSRSVGKEERAGGKPKKELPCRISVKVAGVEAFVYNQSPTYDWVMKQTLKHAGMPPGSSGSEDKTESPVNPPSSSDSNEKPHKKRVFNFGPVKKANTGLSSIRPTESHEEYKKPEVPAFLRIFPVKIECKRAAAALGNENTTSVIAAKLQNGGGTIDAGHSGPFDLYKLLFNFDLENINVTMKPNRDFKQYQLDAAQRILREKETARPAPSRFNFKFVRVIRKRWHSFKKLFAKRKSISGSLRAGSMSSELQASESHLPEDLPGQTQWHGLARYLDDTEPNEHDEWKDVEYAIARTLVDVPKVNMRFYFDVPGKVPPHIGDNDGYEDDINGCSPPDYGMDFAVYGGVVTYGPWSDRQRINLQQLFFPATYVDAIPATALKPGDTRAWTLFKIFVSVEEDVTLRIPAREPSKDEKWRGRAEKTKQTDAQDSAERKRKGRGGKKRSKSRRGKRKQGNPGTDARPYGWIDVTVKTDSTVNYTMDMFARSTGYKNMLAVEAKGTEISSSVNHGLLWRTGPISVEGDLSQPVPWNSLRTWPFDITINEMELFILRDHLFLIIDLVNDWSYGAPSDFWTFVPYVYKLRMLFKNFIMYLNVNDANIVNEPADFDRNDFLTLEGLLDANLDISMDQFRPVRNWIEFDVLTTDMRMRMLSPARTTFNAFLKDQVVAELPKLTLKGSFSGHLEERPGLVDTLRFDIVGSGLQLKAYGFLIRQLINIKENLFGDYMHFKTLEEFQGADDDPNVANLKTASLPKPTSINELDVILCIIAEDVAVMVPTNMYSADEFITLALPVANLDLRILSYYLDMGLQLSPLTILSGSKSKNVDDDDSQTESESSAQIFVKHVDLDGHRAFGLPPNEPAYISQWNIGVGAITGEMSASFAHDLALGARAFIFGFQDRENAIPLDPPSVFYEAAFVQVRTDIVRLWLHVGRDALLFSADPIEVVTNDWASETFSQRVSVTAPKVTLACVDGRSASRNRAPDKQKTAVRTYMFFQTGASVNVLLRKLHFSKERWNQQASFRESDIRTKRAPFLLRKTEGLPTGYDTSIEYLPPASPYPMLPPPLDNAGNVVRRPSSIKSIPSYVNGQQIRRKSSSSSLSASVKAGGLSVPARLKREQSSSTPTSARSLRSSSPASSASSIKAGHPALSSDRKRSQLGLPRSTMAFSSSYAEPYFPLDMVEPDESNVPDFVSMPPIDDGSSDKSSILETIENPDIDQDAAQVSVLIQLMPGIRAYVEPRIAVTGAKLFRKILPKSPEEVMDTFQMDVLGKIAADQMAEHGTNQTLEIQIGLPSARLRAANPAPNEQTDDQLDLSLDSVDTLVRVRTEPSSRGAKEVLAVHAKVDSVGAAFGRASSPPHLLNASLDDVLVWVAVASSRSIHATLGDTILSVAGDQADYALDFVQRLLPLIEELKKKIEAPLETNRNRLLSLIHTLAINSDGVGDPPFLSRMAPMLRAFPDHFRHQESWKVLVRFRYILKNLEPKVLDEMTSTMKKGRLDCPTDEPAKALNHWAQFRNWDVPNVQRTTAFQMLFSEENEEAMNPVVEKPMALTVRSDYLRVAVDAGEASNEIVIEETSLGLDSTPPTAPTGLMLVDENTRTKTVLQMHTSSIAVSANWSVFGMVEKILPLTEKLKQLAPSLNDKKEKVSKSQRLEDGLRRHVVHFVVSTDNGTISLESLNLRHVSRADGLKLSVVGTTQQGEQYGPCATAIVNADAAVTELHGSSRRLWQTLITSPNIYVDYVQPLPEFNQPPSTYIAVGYKVLQLGLLEQIPGMMHIVDSVILDEVTKVLQLIETTKAGASSAGTEIVKQESLPQAGPASPVKIHFALLAGELQLEVSLLQALKYQLVGTAASIRFAPSLSDEKIWSVNFDVGRQSHCFVNSSSKEQQQQSILDVPPINGQVGIELAKEFTSLSIATTMERVDVDPSAIQGVIAVLNQPEVQNVISAIEDSVNQIKGHVDDIKPQPSSPESNHNVNEKQVAFDLRFALLGIRLAAITPRGRGSSTAEIELGIGPFHTVASNRSNLEHQNSLIPEVRAQVRDIGTKLQIHHHGKSYPCGNLTFGLDLHFKSSIDGSGKLARSLKVESHGLEVNAYPDTAATVVDVINHLQDRIRNLDLSKEKEYLRRLRDSRRQSVIQKISGKRVSDDESAEPAFSAVDLLSMTTVVQLTDIKIAWLVDQSFAASKQAKVSDLILSLDSIELSTHGGQEARLTIQDTQLQLAKKANSSKKRPLNSAILPEVNFSVGYWTIGKDRSLTFKAAGKPLEVRLESKFMFPVDAVQRSITTAIDKFKKGTATWQKTLASAGTPKTELFDIKRIASVLVEADFAGAQFYVQGSGSHDQNLATLAASSQQQSSNQHGRYGQFAADGDKMQTMLKAPGIASKIEYNARKDTQQPTVKGEVRVDASSNMLLPNVVPLLLEVSNTVKEVMKNQDNATPKPAVTPPAKPAQRFFEDESIVTADPKAIFGRTKVDLGLRVCRQEFGLTCQPIARVDAKAELDDFYITMNTIESDEHGHFFAISAVVTKLGAQVKHMYSREPTFSYDMESIVLSILNSKHLSGTSGISAILKINPTRTFINGKQLQDLLLFREIWLPPEIRTSSPSSPAPQQQTAPSRPDEYIVQKYQSVAAAAAFPWNATISIAELSVDLDLGQSIGKSSFTIKDLWASQTKSSNFEQNLCIGMEEMAMNSTGRMSGFIRLNKLGVRTSIKWPQESVEYKRTPLIQASVGFGRLVAKAAFDYQAFAFGDIEGFDFLMYNVHQAHGGARDRLVAVLDCDKAYVFCTATSPARAVGLYQAFDRLIQEKQTAFTNSLKDIEKHLRRESTIVPTRFGPTIPNSPVAERSESKAGISLHTDVVLTMGTICFGVFPSTFFDSQILKLEANNIQARFAVGIERIRIASSLGMTLGQLQVALASVRRVTAVPRALDISVDDVVNSAINAKGGIILRVPKVVASMQTWQAPNSNNVDYIFKSLFDGKIDVGWNLSRIDFIKNMYVAHSRSLAARLGKALPESAVKITAGPVTEGEDGKDGEKKTEGQEKITAEVNLPLSKYDYHALEPPIIETPQLRDMGEATPPLEWIGLHRDRLPNVTHQIIIVSLLEVAKEVEDAYQKILGSS